jgi:hypothetical protein
MKMMCDEPEKNIIKHNSLDWRESWNKAVLVKESY